MNKKAYIIVAAVAAMMVGCTKPDPVYIKKPNPWNEEATLEILSDKTLTIDAKQQEVVFNIEASIPEFEVKVDRDWCTAKVVNGNQLVVEVEKNEFSNNRVATITIVAGVYDNITAPQSVTVYQGPGEIALPKVGDIYGTGVVYWVSTAAADAGFRVMSLKRLYGIQAQWSIDFQVTGMTDRKDGRKNMEKVANMSDHPAFNYCATMAENNGKGWYMPAVDEWDNILLLANGGLPLTKGTPTDAEKTKRAEFESFLAANGGDPFNAFVASSNGDSYWTSTEIDEEKAYYILVNKCSTTGGSKTGDKRGVRCVQHFDLR